MRDTDVIVMSTELRVESFDASGQRVIENMLTGQRLALSTNAARILDLFRTPKQISTVASQLGVRNRADREKFQSLLAPLIEAAFLVSTNSNESHAEQPRTAAEPATDLFVRSELFFGGCPTSHVSAVEEGSVVIAGIATDQATTGHPGARYGPDRLREVSRRYIAYELDVVTLLNRGWYSADLGKTILGGVPFADVGNLRINTSEDPRIFYERCYQAALSIHSKKALPVFIGGDHSISAPLIKACADTYSDVTLVHFDAHTDMADWTTGTAHNHGNVMTRVLRENPNLRILQYGIHGFTKEPSLNDRWQIIGQREIDRSLQEVLSSRIPRSQTCYISIDVDVLDPGFAPGTGTPLPLGMEPKTLLRLLEAVAEKNRIVGIDITELCPSLDRDDMTSSLMFQVLMSLLGWVHEFGN